MSETPEKETMPIESMVVLDREEHAQTHTPFVDTARINQSAEHREMLAILGTVAATLRGLSAREAKRATEAEEQAARAKEKAKWRRRRAIQGMILVWAIAAGICFGFLIVKAQGLVDGKVVYFVNAAAVSVAMFVSGWLIGWSKIWE